MNQQWKSIESAPKDELILVGPTKRMGICVAMNHSEDGWVTETINEWHSIYTPTHWMPLPAAPCQTCNGHGMVGGLTPHSGYDAQPCPDCTPPASAQDDVKDEQAAFEDWMERTCPSGDVEAVQRQWEASSDYADFHAPAAGDARMPAINVEAAAKAMAECMDYPWAHMPEQGRAAMREYAQTVIRAASQQQEG